MKTENLGRNSTLRKFLGCEVGPEKSPETFGHIVRQSSHTEEYARPFNISQEL